MSDFDWDALDQAALEGFSRAYAPYSQFRVGAAVMDEQGRVFSGCNVENLSYSLTCCAERTAAFSAVAAGSKRLIACSLVTDTPEPVAPCGACRGVLAELGPEMAVRAKNLDGKAQEFTIEELMPQGLPRDLLDSKGD